MTKKQVLASIRERVERSRKICESQKSEEKDFSELYEYYAGRIDSYDFVLGILSDYD